MTEIDEKYQTPAHKVRAFLANELAVAPETINLTSRLRQDLHVNGVDAGDIVEAFSLTFDIDISGFRVNDYFGPGPERSPFLSGILWIFGNGRPLKTLTVADLVRAFESGKLV